ncbi:MAG: serine hydrolase [Pelagimonas sp.]|nr:serine hydrolase [Pelagimonas sp.]
MFALLLLGIAGIVGFDRAAPQIRVLWNEGFPALVWPARGDFVQIDGVPQRAIAWGDLPDAAKLRLSQTQGRTLLVDQAGMPLRGVFRDMSPNDRLNSYSLVKSLIGVLVVKVVSDGHIADLDQSLQRFLGSEAPDIRIGQALLMQSNLVLTGEPPKGDQSKSTDDADFSPFGAVARLHAFGPEHLFKRLQPAAGPSGVFHYQSVNTALLGAVLEQVHKAPLHQILSDQIWKPAGAATAFWRAYPNTDRASPYCCLYARPVDWLRVGRFLLDNGSEHDPFLSPDLWRAWLLPQLTPQVRKQGAYGWHIRHDVFDRPGAAMSGPFAYMLGHGGQVVYLIPDQDMVVVRFGGQMQLLHSTVYELVKKP